MAEVTRAVEGSESTEASAPMSNSAVVELQGLTEVSEAELMGFTPEAAEEKSAPPESLAEETKPVEEKPKDTPLKEVVKEETPKEETPKEEPVKPPKGFVPIAAIHEVRGENKYLKEQLAEIKAQLENRPVTPVVTETPEPSEFDDFSELSDAEFQELATDSPAEALLYMKQLNKYQEFKRKSAEETQQAAAAQEYLDTVFEKTNSEMEQIVPGIFDPESPAGTEFREFAVDLGFTDDMFYLTNPATQIILPGETEPLLLGEQAAQVIRLLANAKTKVSATQVVDVEKIKAETRAIVEAEFLAKIKTGQPFRSLSDVPVSNENRPEFKGKELSEAEFARLNAKEQELYLAGE